MSQSPLPHHVPLKCLKIYNILIRFDHSLDYFKKLLYHRNVECMMILDGFMVNNQQVGCNAMYYIRINKIYEDRELKKFFLYLDYFIH